MLGCRSLRSDPVPISSDDLEVRVLSNYNTWRPELTLRITVAALIAVFGIAFIVAFVLSDRRAEITFAAAVVAASAGIYSAYHAGMTLRVNLYRDRQKRSYEILDSFNRVDSVSVRVIVDSDMSGVDSPQTAYRTIVEDPQKHASIRHLLGLFEDLAIAIRTGYADEPVLFWSLQFAAVHYYDGLKRYIDGIRSARHNNNFYTEFEKLVGAWRTGKSLVTGKPVEPL